MRTVLKYTAFLFFLAFVFYGTFLMLQITIPYFSFKYDIGFLLTKQAVLHVDAWRWSFYVHITFSIFVLFLGAFQFSTYIRKKFVNFHRNVGKVYVFLVLFLSAPSGFIMGLYANGGIYSKISFVILSLLWWWFTFMAYRKIRQKNIREHEAYMYRSYALTLSALTFRFLVLILPLFIHLAGAPMYTLIAWLSWVPNLLVAELLIRERKKHFSLD
jgi:uncharacterized membrane protein